MDTPPGLFAGDALDAAQLLGVGGGDERDDRHVGQDHPRQRDHLVRRADARLDHGEFVGRGIEARERQRHADMVVQVTLGGVNAARTATEEERQQILGGGFARAA
jgi:hypothetical protein